VNLRTSINAARIGDPQLEADGATRFEFRFSADDPTFAGHFPGGPILPGVFQLEMARAAAEWLLAGALTMREISKAKFQRPILPEETVRLALKVSEADGLIRARAIFSVNGQPAGETALSLCRNQS
jgi:3-hydroxyacyl-[acyl-carrier-protein] dehydratase